MSDIPNEPVWFLKSAIKADKVRHPSNFPPLSEPVLISIGQIAANWSLFEQKFEEVLERLVFTNQTDDPDWRGRLRGRKRRNRLVAEAKIAFAGHPALLTYIQSLHDDAHNFATKRNTLLHGSLRHHFRGPSDNLQYWIEADGDDGTFVFTADELEDFAYDIAHLAGRMASICSPTDGDHGFASQDIQTLLDFEARSRPSLPKDATPPVRLKSSGEINVFVSGGGDLPDIVR